MIIYNRFVFPWKVPSLNEMSLMRGITGKTSWLLKPGKKKKRSPYQFNMYNQLKQEWSTKVSNFVKSVGYTPVDACYFNYLVVERTKKRDPSNVFASAVKFIEDGLQVAGVIPNDGWDNVLGINSYMTLDRKSEGAVLLIMADLRLSELDMLDFYNERSS